MPKEMTLPKIGVNMTEALIIKWVVKEGDTIREGDHILDAETDKAVQEIQATASGILAKILVQPGETVAVHTPIAILTEPGEKLSDDFLKTFGAPGADNADTPGPGPIIEQAPLPGPCGVEAGGDKRVRISPLAKKVAKELGVDYTRIKPEKPGARIVKKDILAYYEQSRLAQKRVLASRSGTILPEDAFARGIPLAGTRKVIAERMAESHKTIPPVALTLHADAGALLEWRERLKRDGKTVSLNAFLVAIAAKALREFSVMNSRLVDQEIQLIKDINIGVAVDSEKGLVVPVIHGADGKSLLAIQEELQEKLERARAGKSTLEDLSGGTFSITNLGMFEIEMFIPIINPPECCILSVGSVVHQPVVADDGVTIEVRPRMQLALVFDHRIVDGAPAARFLQRIKHLVEWPLNLIS